MAPQSVFITGCNRGWKAGISLLLVKAYLLTYFSQLWQELFALPCCATIGQATTFWFSLRITIVAPNCNYNKQQITKDVNKSSINKKQTMKCSKQTVNLFRNTVPKHLTHRHWAWTGKTVFGSANPSSQHFCHLSEQGEVRYWNSLAFLSKKSTM